MSRSVPGPSNHDVERSVVPYGPSLPHFTTSFSKNVVVFLETSDEKLEDKFYHFMIGRRLNLLHKSRPHSRPRPGIDFLTGEGVGGKF